MGRHSNEFSIGHGARSQTSDQWDGTFRSVIVARKPGRIMWEKPKASSKRFGRELA
jgi:hypothetical protein